MDKIIKFGFVDIHENFLTNSAKANGKNLVEGGHLSHVIEVQKRVLGSTVSAITAKVIPQTSVKKSQYDVKLQLDSVRNVTSAVCSCPAGLGGGCKHLAATIYYVNSNHSSATKTDSLQRWGIPSAREKYKKGCTVASLYPRQPRCRQAPSVASDILLNQRSSEDYTSEKYDSGMIHEERTFYERNVFINEDDDLIKIAIRTVDQSASREWFEQRKCRISATKAHPIFTKKKDFKGLATRFIENRKFESEATKYGLKTEKEAASWVRKILGDQGKLLPVGLIIKKSQS
ncbi:uncharacterized protein LOC107046728 [Diachasma alloeum]|uniref:uncharacterized protein LOC107046728 n=1 Tax=Diachasma alloeum TaxID=454923 RepID=UPI000738184A|nr:uncharacterized protein LOC107046728 [Diachasma alloeum]